MKRLYSYGIEDEDLQYSSFDEEGTQTFFYISDNDKIYSQYDTQGFFIFRETREHTKLIFDSHSGFFEIEDGMLVIVSELNESIPYITYMDFDGAVLSEATNCTNSRIILSELFTALCADRFYFGSESEFSEAELALKYQNGRSEVTMNIVDEMIEKYREAGIADGTEIDIFKELSEILSLCGISREDDITDIMRAIFQTEFDFKIGSKRPVFDYAIKVLHSRCKEDGYINLKAINQDKDKLKCFFVLENS